MIVRVWRARATREKAPAYREHLETAVFPVLKDIDGFVSAQLLERPAGEQIELTVESRWTSMAAVRSFAGDAFEKAVVAPAARQILSWVDERVTHHEVTTECKR